VRFWSSTSEVGALRQRDTAIVSELIALAAKLAFEPFQPQNPS
jgi:hypothetical protein